MSHQPPNDPDEPLVGYPWGTAPPGWTGAYNGQNEQTLVTAHPLPAELGGEKNWVQVTRDRWVWHELVAPFDFQEARRNFPDHWSADGWPAGNSTWQAIDYPLLRVRVLGRSHKSLAEAWPRYASPFEAVLATVYWNGDLEDLHDLFGRRGVFRYDGIAHVGLGTVALDDYEAHERFELDEDGLVLRGARIAREGTGPTLHLSVERAMFGGPDTFQVRLEEELGPFPEALPFFEPDPD